MTSCINCGDPDVKFYDVMVRGDEHDDIPLCDDCHAALPGDE
jgi:hypothetical protein